jgi:hypothetical protein
MQLARRIEARDCDAQGGFSARDQHDDRQTDP